MRRYITLWPLSQPVASRNLPPRVLEERQRETDHAFRSSPPSLYTSMNGQLATDYDGDESTACDRSRTVMVGQLIKILLSTWRSHNVTTIAFAHHRKELLSEVVQWIGEYGPIEKCEFDHRSFFPGWYQSHQATTIRRYCSVGLMFTAATRSRTWFGISMALEPQEHLRLGGLPISAPGRFYLDRAAPLRHTSAVECTFEHDRTTDHGHARLAAEAYGPGFRLSMEIHL